MYQTRKEKIWNKLKGEVVSTKMKPRPIDASAARKVLDRLKTALEAKEGDLCQIAY